MANTDGLPVSRQALELNRSSAEVASTRVFFIGLIGVFSYFLVFLSFAEIKQVLVTIPDDAAYFFKAAENITAGKGLTFDGINSTNGFQPLWLLALVPLYEVVHGTPETMVRIVLTLQLGFLTLCALLTYWLQSRFFGTLIGSSSGLLFLFLVLKRSVNGMESAILIFTTLVLFTFGWRERVFTQHHPRSEFVFGIILGLVILSRLDMIFLAVAVLAFCFLTILVDSTGKLANLIRFLLILAGFAAIVVPYMAYNYLVFDDIMPISGTLKSSFPLITFAGLDFASTRTSLVLISISLALGYHFWFIARIRVLDRYQYNRRYFHVSMAIFSVAILLHFVHTVLFMKWAVFEWHFAPYTLFLAVAAAPLIEQILYSNRFRGQSMLYWLGVCIILMYGGYILYRYATLPLDRSWQVASYDASIWTKNNVDKTAILAMKDAGIFGYFSQRQVINLDGLVNNMEYQDALRDRRLKDYLRSKGAQYLVQHAFWDRMDINSGNYETFSIAFKSHKYLITSDELVLKKKDEVYRSQPYFDGSHRTVFVIWRMPDERTSLDDMELQGGPDSNRVGLGVGNTRRSLPR